MTKLAMKDALTRVIVGVAIALGALDVAGVFIFGGLVGPKETVPLLPLAWVLPTAQAFQILAAIAIALLFLGRYRALGDGWVLWTGTVFLANGILGIFYLLSWPGLLGDRGVIAQLSNTASWLFNLNYSCITLLLVTVGLGQPNRLKSSHALAIYIMAALVAAMIGALSVLFENALPTMVVGVDFTPLTLVWIGVLVVLAAIAATRGYKRYAKGEDAMLGYVVLFLVIMVCGLLIGHSGGKRYDVYWYVSRLVYIAAYMVVLFGFLQEGYVLVIRERAQAEVRARLARQVQELAEVAGRRANELETIVESIADAVFVCDSQGQITLANRAGLSLVGEEKKEALGTLTNYLERLQLHSSEGRPIPLTDLALNHALRGEVSRGREVIATHPKTNRQLNLLISAAPLRNAAGQVAGAVEVGTDITQVRQLAEEAQHRAAELDVANKELEAFSYSVSHDLRAPLRHIDGFSRILLQAYADKLDERGKQYLQFLHEGSQRMEQLIDAMLKLSRVTRAEMRRQPVNLSELAESILAELRKEQPDRQVELTIARDAMASGDPQLLRVVLENLLGNAWKFTSKRPITKIEFGVTRQNGKLRYFVKDNGAGFDAAHVDKLFGAFQRLHRAEEFPGTGIGLATVQRIIHRHGGSVCAEGAVDQGATFYFTLG